MGQDFHLKCDKRGATITLYKIANGPCIGGFTSAQWTTPVSNFFGQSFFDSSAMLFNLTEERSYSILQPEKAIYCFKYAGPCFGNEELYLEQPFNGENLCRSFSNQGVFDIKTKNMNTNLLTNQKDGYFSITEIEVWEIK